MGNEENKRICRYCGIEFILTAKQKIQRHDKWPIHCSRSCSKKTQHKKNHIKQIRNCPICGKEFYVATWNNERKYCSIKCSATARFGEIDRKKMIDKCVRILEDKNYFKFIKSKAFKILKHYPNEFLDDAIQDYFLGLCSGLNITIEQSCFNFLRKEIKRGIVGKWDCNFSFITQDAFQFIEKKYSFLNSVDFIEYIFDLKKCFSEIEFHLIILFINGLVDYDAMKEIRKKNKISNMDYYKTKKKLNL